MYLLVDTISISATYILFDDERKIVWDEVLELRGRESEHFLISLLEFLTKNKLEFHNLLWVIVVNGPGSFTAMRIITLTLNTLSFVHHIPLYGIDYFTLGHVSGWAFPMVIRANRWEYLVRKNQDTPDTIIAIADIEPGVYFGIGDTNDFTNTQISVQSHLRYDIFCKNMVLKDPTERIEPFYIKKPNIT